MAVEEKNFRRLNVHNGTDIDTSNLYVNSSTQIMEGKTDDTLGYKEFSNFKTLWKSGVITFASMCFSQLKANNVEHEYSTNLTQKLCYFIASVCNTMSFLALALMGVIQVFDIVILLSNITNKFVPWWFLFITVYIPCVMISIMAGILAWLVKRSFYDFHLHQGNIDQVPSTDSYRNVAAYLFCPIVDFLLPTSSPRTYFREKHYISYQCISSTRLLDALINHWLKYIFICLSQIFKSAFRLYLMFGEAGSHTFEGKLDFSYAKISPTRFNFEVISSVVIPLGWILENCFLYMYFIYDQGYFSVANLHFHYKGNASFQKPILRAFTLKYIRCLVKFCYCKMFTKRCCKIEEDNTSEIEKEDEIGEWVDLSGQEKYNLYKNINEANQNEDIEMNSLLSLDETEKAIFEMIKPSFPYYRNY